MTSVVCASEADTEALAGRVAALLRPGDVLVLAGRLGCGKTRFTQGLAAGLGVEEQVVSPSFVLARRYDSGFLPLVHADVYRLGSLNEFEDLDLFDWAEDGVLVLEWGHAVEAVLPPDYLRIEFDVHDDETRVLAFRPAGTWERRDLGDVA